MATIGRGQQLLAAAEELELEILAARDDIESGRCLPQALVEQMHRQGMFGLWLPTALKGPELHPIEFVRVIEALAKADGSVGWCATNAGVISLLAGHMDETGAREVFANGTIGAGSFNPAGRAVAEPGGYRVSGRWTYGSGISHCDWVLGNCVVTDGAPGDAMRFMMFPKRLVNIFDTWHVSGLRGTGSNDFKVEDVFVPASHSLPAFAVATVQPGTLYRMPLQSLFTVALAAVMLGIAAAAIEALIELAGAKTPTGANSLLRDKLSAQAAVARAEALVRAARATVFTAIEEQWEEAAHGPPSMARRGVLKLATTFCAEACATAVDIVHDTAGGSALMESGRIARCFRDVHAATQHIGLSAGNYELAGRVLFGMEPGTLRF